MKLQDDTSNSSNFKLARSANTSPINDEHCAKHNCRKFGREEMYFKHDVVKPQQPERFSFCSLVQYLPIAFKQLFVALVLKDISRVSNSVQHDIRVHN